MKLKNGWELEIRQAVPEDAENIIVYLNRVGGQSDNLLFGKDEIQISVEEEKEIILNKLNSEKECMLIGIIAGRIASVVSLMSYGRERIAHRGAIALSVEQDFWGMGVAYEMLKELIKYAKNQAKMEVLELEVRSDNGAAIHLYEKAGFQKFGTYSKFFKIQNEFFDAEYMTLNI